MLGRRKWFSGKPSRDASTARPVEAAASPMVFMACRVWKPRRITSRQIEAARQAMTRKIKRSGRVWIRIFRIYPSAASRTTLGWAKAKAIPEFYVARVKPGTVMFEMNGVDEDLAKEAMRLAAHKLPVQTKFIIKKDL